MFQKPELDVVLLAISSLYKSTNNQENAQASKWLGELQASVHAWTVADELLHHKRDLESCYFAAQTLRKKIQNSFSELPPETYGSLRDSLLEHMSQLNEQTNTVIVTQLSLALADLILQMPSWPRASLDIISKLSTSNVWPLLEVLTVLPEELDGKTVRLGENRRVEMFDDLKFCSGTLLEFLFHCVGVYNVAGNVQVNVKILKCFTSWISVGAFELTDLSSNLVVSLAFEVLVYKPESEKPAAVNVLHNAATDCVCALLHSLEYNNNQQSLETYLYTHVVGLEVAYHMSVANEDQEKSMNYCRMFTELAEALIEKIVTQHQHYAMQVLNLVLICVGHHDYEVAEITFNLWYLLSEDLYQRNNKEVTELFRPYVERLITALCRHSQMEPDQDGLLDDADDFKDFRGKVFDLIKDVVFIVGSSNCFRHMFINLQAPDVTWDASEASLFVMQAVAKNIVPTENEVVPKVVEAILALPQTTHIAVKCTSVMLLGELCEWMEKHPATLDPILNFLVCCLPQQGIGAAAAVALQNICTICNEHMGRHIPVLLQLVNQVNTFAITNNAVIGLLKGVAAIIGCLNPQELTGALRELCFMQLNPLCQLIEQDVVPVKGTKTDPVLWLDRLSSVLRNTNCKVADGCEHPCKPVVLEVWPVLSRTIDKFEADSRIMERCCRAVRFMLRSVPTRARDLLPGLVAQMVRVYAARRHSCFLYVGSILVDEYAGDAECVQGLLDMLTAYIEPTFAILQEENGLKNHPDTVDDFFRLCTRFIQRAPMAFLRGANLVHILQCALLASNLDHKEANMSVMKFFYDLLSQAIIDRRKQDFEERKRLVVGIVDEFGQSLVTGLVHASVFSLHSYMLCEVADVFVQLLEVDRERCGKWLGEGLAALPQQSNGIVKATPQQLKDAHVTIVRSDTAKSITQALKDLCRLYR